MPVEVVHVAFFFYNTKERRHTPHAKTFSVVVGDDPIYLDVPPGTLNMNINNAGQRRVLVALLHEWPIFGSDSGVPDMLILHPENIYTSDFTSEPLTQPGQALRIRVS